MRAIMAVTILSVSLALALTLAVYRPAWTEEPEATASPEATTTPSLLIPIEIINGELYIAIEVDGMPNESEE